MGRCGRCHPVGTPPSGAVWPLPPRGPSTSRTLMATASRSSSDTSPNLTTGNKSSPFFFFIIFFNLSVSHVFLSLSLFLSVIFYLFILLLFSFFISFSLCTDSIFLSHAQMNIYIFMSLKSLLKTHDEIITFTFHDGEILKSEYIHVIALSGRKHIEIYRRGDSKKKKKKKKKKKRLIKEKMDIEKKRE